MTKNTSRLPLIAGIFGSIQPPPGSYMSGGDKGAGLFLFINNIFKFAAVIAGIYMVFQIIMAGYAYINANGDVKKTAEAWAMIWQSVMGMVIVAAAFVIASLVGRFVGIDVTQPVIYGPN